MFRKFVEVLDKTYLGKWLRKFLPLYVWIRETISLQLIPTVIRGIRQHGFQSRATISFSPDPIRQHSVIKRYAYLNRYRIVPASRPADIKVFWAYGAESRPVPAGFEEAINAQCQDISKSYVDQMHKDVFGYNLAVDPLTFEGRAFAKSELNAAHDGIVVTLPLSNPDPNLVYQVLIDNEVGDSVRQDIRILIIDGDIAHTTLVHRKQLTSGMISGRIPKSTELVPANEILSEEEIEHILDLCSKMGLDYGELDALRDKHTGRLYVVDVNRAVGGLPTPGEMNNLEQYWKQLEIGARAFDAAFLPTQNGRSHRTNE